MNLHVQAEYGLDRILAKLVDTSRTVITMAFFVMNAEKILRLLRLLLSIFVSVYILMLCLCASWRRPALLWAAWLASRSKTGSPALDGEGCDRGPWRSRKARKRNSASPK